MAKATKELLDALHGLITQSFMSRLTDDIRDGIPTDAATLGVIKGFLKDNEITADLASMDDLKDLQDKFSQTQAKRGKLVSLVNKDKKEAVG